MIRDVCPRCANGRPGCRDDDPTTGHKHSHDQTCATYEWADDVCDECKPYVYGESIT